MKEVHYHTATESATGRHSFSCYVPGMHTNNRIEPPENSLPSVNDYPDFMDFNTREGKTVRYIREDKHENH